MENNNTPMNTAACLGFLAGSIAGASIALLYAPSSGRETRERISAKSKDLSQMAMHKGQQALDSAKEAKDAATASIANKVTQVSAGVTKFQGAVVKGHEAFRTALAAEA